MSNEPLWQGILKNKAEAGVAGSLTPWQQHFPRSQSHLSFPALSCHLAKCISRSRLLSLICHKTLNPTYQPVPSSSNLRNWKEEAWKKQGFNRIRTRGLRDTGAMLYQLSYEATHWERGQFIEFISSVQWNDVKYIWNNSYIILLWTRCATPVWTLCSIQSVYNLDQVFLGAHTIQVDWCLPCFEESLAKILIERRRPLAG